MKKHKKNKTPELNLQNPVAKYARQFNKSHIFADKNQYRRHSKHRKQEVSLTALYRVFKKTFCFCFNSQNTTYHLKTANSHHSLKNVLVAQ